MQATVFLCGKSDGPEGRLLAGQVSVPMAFIQAVFITLPMVMTKTSAPPR